MLRDVLSKPVYGLRQRLYCLINLCLELLRLRRIIWELYLEDHRILADVKFGVPACREYRRPNTPQARLAGVRDSDVQSCPFHGDRSVTKPTAPEIPRNVELDPLQSLDMVSVRVKN